MLSKGSNIHLLLSQLLFFLSLRKANISCQMERNFSFQYNAEKCTFGIKFIFSLRLSSRKKKKEKKRVGITALPQTFLSGNTFSDSPWNNPFHYSPLSQNTSTVSEVFLDGSQPAVQWQTHLRKSYYIYFQPRISTKSFWVSHYNFNNNTPPSSMPHKKTLKNSNQPSKHPPPTPPFPNLSPTKSSLNSQFQTFSWSWRK